MKSLLTMKQGWSQALGCDDTLPETMPGRTPSTSDKEELEEIVAALRACRWHRGEAAKMLCMDRSTLYRKMLAFGIRPPQKDTD